MKNLRLVAFLGGSFFVSSALVLAACSSDDTVVTVTPDSGTDAGPGKDTGTPDTNVPDTNVPDTNPPFDAGLKPETFANTVANALCNALTRCCFGQTNVPEGGALDGGGTFDRPECIALYTDLGFENSLVGEDAITKGNVTLDQAKGKECIDKINALTCNLTGAELKTARAACFGALAGKLAAGQPCRASLECAPGNFCLPDGDAGVIDGGALDAGGSQVIGKCAALRGQGGNCSIVETGASGSNEEIDDSIRGEEACSYRGGGDTNLRCDSYDFVNGVYRARADWKCAPMVGASAGCNTTVWCSDGICDPTSGFVCKSPVDYFTQASCGAHTNP